MSETESCGLAFILIAVSEPYKEAIVVEGILIVPES